MSGITVAVDNPESTVSKSIFYTGPATNNGSLGNGFNLIETRLVPHSISSIKPKKEKTIACSQCNYTTHAKYYLNEHYRYVHKKVKVLCDLCGKEFANINQHMRVSHKVLRSGILTKKPCQECHKSYYDLTKHMAKAHKLKYEYEYNCEICHLKLATKFILQRHMQRKHGNKASCPECGKRVSNLEVHIKKMHSNPKKQSQTEARVSENLETCVVEKRSDGDNVGLKLVAGTQTGDIVTIASKDLLSDPFQVHLEGFERSKADRDREERHVSENDYILSQLRKLTPTNPSEMNVFDNYMFEEQSAGQESSGRKSPSETGGQFLITRGETGGEIELNIDGTVRQTQQPGQKEKRNKKGATYHCTECDYSSNRSANYNMHYQMVHLKSRTRCQICGKPYSNINQHMRVVHKKLKSGKTQKTKCPHCPQEFYDLDKHIRRAHGDVVQSPARDSTCNVCGLGFTKYANMKRHQLRIHEGFKVTCPVCNKKVSNIDKHKIVHNKKDVNTAIVSQSTETLSYVEEENILEITESHYILQPGEIVEAGGKPGSVIQFSQLVPLMPHVELVQISKEQ